MPRSRTIKTETGSADGGQPAPAHDQLLRDVVEHLTSGRDEIRHAWVSEMARRGLARLLTPEEAETESARIYDDGGDTKAQLAKVTH